MIPVLWGLASFVIGALPFGVWVAKTKGVDILSYGSGNPGATNVGRALGKKFFFVVFILDMLKGLVPAAVAGVLFPKGLGPLDAQPTAFLFGILAVLGHSKSPFLKFRGGKGVSTALGAGLGSAPLPALAAFALFGIVLKTTKYMSVASLTGVFSVILFALLIPGNSLQMVPLYALLAGVVTWGHRANIARLRAGTEPRFGDKKPVT